MAAPLVVPRVTAMVTKAGRIVYKNSKGGFISKSTFLRELRRGANGKFGPKSSPGRTKSERQLEQFMKRHVGNPMGGGTWIARIRKSSDRFADMMAAAG